MLIVCMFRNVLSILLNSTFPTRNFSRKTVPFPPTKFSFKIRKGLPPHSLKMFHVFLLGSENVPSIILSTSSKSSVFRMKKNFRYEKYFCLFLPLDFRYLKLADELPLRLEFFDFLIDRSRETLI